MNHLRLGAAALLLATLCLPSGLAAQDPKVAKMLETADAAFEKGRYEEAFERYQKANQESDGGAITAILGALEASLVLGRYDGIITQVSGASSENPTEQAQIDALVGRAHMLTAYVVDPTRSPAEREALAMEHRKRAMERLQSAGGGEGDWATRSLYYLAEVEAALGNDGAAQETLESFFGRGGAGMPEASSAESLRRCMAEGDWVHREEPAKVLPSKQKGPAPRRAADGASILAAVLDAEGRLTCMRMIPPLSEKANEIVYETLARWTYTPAENAAGEPIATPYTVTLDFTAE